MKLAADWHYPTEIRFGPGRIAELGRACRSCGLTRPLLVTDPELARLPAVETALGLLRAEELEVELFDGVRPNPTDANLVAGLRAFNAGAHNGVVAIGGGSALDLGKLVAFMAGQDRPVWDFEDIGDRWKRADPDAIAPVVAIPTTAGTGSEVGRAAVLTNTEIHTKKIIFHPKMIPEIAILDPELAVTMPRQVTAGTGMDAFAHCLEAYCATGPHPMADGIALEGMRLVNESLHRSYKHADDIEARAAMMCAAAMGATAFQKGLGAIHALSHPIGAIFDAHHGLTNAVVMPTVLEFNRPAIEDKIVRAGAYMGISGGFRGFVRHVRGLCGKLAIPRRLSRLGVTEDVIDSLVEMALTDPAGFRNPIPLDRDNVTALYRACL